MPKIFEKSLSGAGDDISTITLVGENARHISRSLRMCTGENLTVSDGCGRDFGCQISGFDGEAVTLKVLFVTPSESEADTFITVYQGVPKGDKLSEVIQKCTEVGASRFVPTLMARSISRPDSKSAVRKSERWQKIAEQAAEQSRRGIVPEVSVITDFSEAVKQIQQQPTIVFYEGGGEPLKDILCKLKSRAVNRLNIFIGPEGGFEPCEIDALESAGAFTATLGKRILRTETAPVAAVANILYELG